MQVRDLIEELKRFDDHAEVTIDNNDGFVWTISKVVTEQGEPVLVGE